MAESARESAGILPFLPLALAQWYRDHPGQIHQSTVHSGALACLDASGFTALTGELEKRGRDGPEILTQILNRFFSLVIETAERFDGDVLKFSGDGLWLYLPDPLSLALFAEAAQDAMSGLNGGHPYLRQHPISLHIGAEAGSFELVSFGDSLLRLEAEPVGSVVSEAYARCDQAKSGELRVGPELRRIHGFAGESQNLADDLRSAGVTGSCVTSDEPLQVERVTTDPLLWRYVPQALVGRLTNRFGRQRMDSEYRDVTVLFCQCSWPPESFDSEREFVLSQVRQVMRRVGECEGSLARIDPFKLGHKFLILFGAPVSRRDDQWRALECARQIAAISSDRFQVRVGIAHGRTFCGTVGSSRRMEYTLMGSAANLAARLMGKAEWGTILFDETMRGLLPPLAVSVSTELSVKGFSAPIKVHRFDRFDDRSRENSADSLPEEFMHSSYKRTLDWLGRFINERSRGAAIIRGDHGAGKSLLLRSCRLACADHRQIVLDASQSLFFGPGYLARKLLETLASINAGVSTDGLDRWISDEFSEEPLSVLRGVIAVGSDDVWTRDLSPQLHFSMAKSLFVKIVRRLLNQHVVIIVDDLDRSDALSLQLVVALCESSNDLDVSIIASISGNVSVSPLLNASLTAPIELSAPSEEEWRNFFAERFSGGRREQDLVEQLIGHVGRLPGTVFEFLKDRLRRGDIASNPVTTKWELKHSGTEIAVPRSTRDLQLEKFDSLPGYLRTILKMASIAPTDFSIETITNTSAELTMSQIRDCLAELSGAGIMLELEATGQYQFASQSMKEAVYGCIPHADLVAWHARAANWVERHEPNRIALLAHHHTSAENVIKGFAFSLTAARSAMELFALTDAARYFENCSMLISLDVSHQLSGSQLIEFYRAFTRFLVLEGRHREAYRSFHLWRRLAAAESDASSAIEAALGTAELLWQQARYSRCSRALQAILQRISAFESPDLAARGMTLMAEVARRAGRFAEAESWARSALDKANEPSAKADAHNRLGLALWGLGRLQDASECFQHAMSAGEGSHSMYNRARVANNLAIVHWQMGALTQAEPLMLEAIDIFRRQGDRRNEAYARGNLAALIREFGRHADARRMLAEADIIFQRLQDRHAHFYTVGNLGDIDLVTGDLNSALERFNEALAFAESVSDDDLRAECKVRLGELAFYSDDADAAEQSLTEAIKLADDIGSGEYSIRARVSLARVKASLRDVDALRSLSAKISELARESRSTVMDREAQFLQGEYFRITGDHPSALLRFIKALAYAREQCIFELSLKCSVRIIELSDSPETETETFLDQLAQRYDRDNGPGSWQALLDSRYFSFFRNALLARTRRTRGPLPLV